MIKEKSQTIKVIVRFRPLINIELALGETQLNWFNIPNESTISIHKDSTPDTYTYDRVFPITTKQVEIFECLGKPIVEDVLAGYNGTVFAYGQTGSGKTFTMMGSDIFDPDLRGLIPRAVSLIFETINSHSKEVECTIKCSMLEIYKENLQDLLVRGPKLKIKESPIKGIYVDGLSEIYVVCEEEVLNAIAIGEKNRSIASTKMNQQSSRSHQIFILEVSQKLPDGTVKKGCLNLVDLAGSEKINQTGATGEKLEEAKKINLSLSALGNVIKALTSGAEHIPYRDSKLTRLLQESLGGNFKTSLIVNCSPHPRNTEDSINTLKFAQRAKSIKNSAKANVTLSVEAYIKTIEHLKQQLAAAQLEIVKLEKIINEHKNFARSTTSIKQSNSMIEPVSPIEPVSQLIIDNTQVEQMRDQIEALNFENQELRSQLKENERKLSNEKFKKVEVEKKLEEISQRNGFIEIQLSEKQAAEARLLTENKKLESQLSFLTQVLKDFSLKYTSQLQKLMNGQELSQSDYFIETISNIDQKLLDAPVSFKKYFPESIKLAEFLSLYKQFKVSPEVALRERLLLTEISSCELFSSHWSLFCKYIILKQRYSSLFSSFDMQKKTLSSFKKLVQNMQVMYSDMFAKVYKYAMTAAASTASKMRRPVNNAVPEVFQGSNPPNKEFLRRASLFHMVSNGFDSNFMTDPKKESLLVKNIENKLEVQTLMNNQLKIDAKSIKEEKIKLESLVESLQFNQVKFESELSVKVEQLISDLEQFIKDPLKAEEKVIGRTTSLKIPENLELIDTEVQRKRDKNLTLSPKDALMSNMKSSLSANFVKANPSPMSRKEGDLSPMFCDRKLFFK